MTATLLVSVVSASLLGSLHCAAMCGGFVAFYSGNAERRASALHLSYHGGRFLAYGALGVAAGLLGKTLNLAGHSAGLGRIAGLTAGVFMLLWGALILLELSGKRLLPLSSGSHVYGRALRRVGKLLAPHPTLRAGVLGLFSALLPCGWLYAFVLAAAGTGHALSGALVMIAFWSGTLPMLLGLGFGIHTLGAKLRNHLPVISACVLIVLGLFGVFGRLNIPAQSFAATRAAFDGSSTVVSSGDEPPCHRAH